MGLAYPGHDREQSYLFEHGQFGEEEREELIEDWRREFEKTLSPDFAYCVGQRPDGQGAKWLHGQAARKAHYRWADISASLVEQWTRERRHPSPPPDRDRGEPRGSSHRVTGGGRPPPVPTERSVRISRTTLFGRCFTALQEPATPHMGGAALVSVTASLL